MLLGRISCGVTVITLCSATVALAPASATATPKVEITEFAMTHSLAVKTSNGRHLELRLEATSESLGHGYTGGGVGVDITRRTPNESHDWSFVAGGNDLTYDAVDGTGTVNTAKDLGGFGSVKLAVAAKGKPTAKTCGQGTVSLQRVAVSGTIRFATHSGSRGWGVIDATSGSGQFAQPSLIVQITGSPNMSCLLDAFGGGATGTGLASASGGLAALPLGGCPGHVLETGRFDGRAPLIDLEQRSHGRNLTYLFTLRIVSQQAGTEDVFRIDTSDRRVPRPRVTATRNGVRVVLHGNGHHGVTGSAVLVGTGKPRKIHLGCNGKKYVGHVWNHGSYTNGKHPFTLVDQAFGNVRFANSKRKGKIGFLGSFLPPKPLGTRP